MTNDDTRSHDSRRLLTDAHYKPPDVRILLLSQDFPPSTGGIQTYARELATCLAPRAAALTVLCPDAPGAANLDRTLPFPVLRVAGSSDAFPARCAPLAMRLVAQGRADVMLHAQWQSAPVGALLRRTGRVRTLGIAVHGKELLLRPLARLPAAQRAYDALRARVLETADIVLPVSTFSGSLLTRVSAHCRATVVPNGVAPRDGGDGAAFRARHGLGDAPLLVTVARLVARKGVDSVIAALPSLLASAPGARYVVVGDGPDAPRLGALARHHGVASRVHLLGRLDDADLRDAYAAADVFVLAARDEPESVEGFGLVLLEASSAGVPVVITRAGGMTDAVEHGVTGLVVPPDDAAALVAALGSLLATPELRKSLGAAGRTRALTRFSWDMCATRVASLLADAYDARADEDRAASSPCASR